MGMVDAMMALGMLLGTLCSSFVFEAGGYVLIYGLDLLINILACLYARFIIRESIPENLADVSSYLVPTYVTVTVKCEPFNRSRYSRSKTSRTCSGQRLGGAKITAERYY